MNERKLPPERPRSFLRRMGESIDRAIYEVAPSWGGRRLAMRKQLEVAERLADARVQNLFDGADSDRLRGSKWMASRLSTDSELELDLPTLRTRSNELYATDSIGGAVDSCATQVVGTGFTPQAQIDFDELGIDKEAAKTFNRQIEKQFKRWAKKADRDRRKSLWQISRLACRAWLVDGESLVVMSDVGDADSVVPLALEVVAAERLETPPEKSGDPRVRMGIERDAKGKITHYWIRKTHPADTLDVNDKYDRVPAWRVCHVFESLFTGQSRGLPWMFRVLNRLRDAKDTDEAAVIAMQVQACYSAFVKNSDVDGYAAATGAANGTFTNGQRYEELEPGSVRYLRPGEEITFATPSQPGTNHERFMEWAYRRIAAGMNYAYEMLVKSWKGLSFAGGRLVLQETRVDLSCKQKFLTEQLLEMVWNRAVEEMVILGVVAIDAGSFKRAREAWLEHKWTPPKWPFSITPKEEIEADILEVEHNMATLEEKIASRGGGDIEQVFERRQSEVKEQRTREILPGALEAEATAAPQTAEQDLEKAEATAA